MPSSSNFDSVTKYLDRFPSTVDTEHVTKAADRRVARAIKKIHYQFIIPAMTIDLVALGAQQAGCIVAQFNFTAPAAFRVLAMQQELEPDLGVFGVVCIRHRVGETVTRYRLPVVGYSELETFVQLNSKIQAPVYTNQRIQSNFAIEIWNLTTGQELVVVGPLTVTTGLLRNPVVPEELSDDIEVLEGLSREDLSVPFPEPLPTVYGDSSCWLTN